MRPWLAAGLTNELLAVRNKRFTRSATTKMPNTCRTIDSVDSVRNETVLDIGDSTGEYNIESGTMLVCRYGVLSEITANSRPKSSVQLCVKLCANLHFEVGYEVRV